MLEIEKLPDTRQTLRSPIPGSQESAARQQPLSPEPRTAVPDAKYHCALLGATPCVVTALSRSRQGQELRPVSACPGSIVS